MKKTYIAPNAKGIEIYTEGLVAFSSNVDNNAGVIEGGDSNRRHVSIWDNDEE